MPNLIITELNKSFKDSRVLENISLSTGDGELIVVLGPSGCGKSTLLRLIAGLEQPDKGEIFIGERRVDSLPPRRRNVALVFQNYALYPHMTVARNLSFPLKVAGEKKQVIKKRIKETADLLGLGDRLEAYPAELSGGQRQRVALGRAIIRKPDLFLLDEPLSNLDADLRNRMRREIVQLQKRLGVTTVYVTHDQVEALTMADRMVVIESGRIRQVGTVDEIYSRPADMFVASFIGTPKMNFLPARIDGALIKPFNLSKVLVPAKYTFAELTLGIRPEDIKADGDGNFVGRVAASEYLGDKSVLTVQFVDHPLTIVTEPNRYEIGADLTFSIDTDRVHIFEKESGKNVAK